MDIQELIDTIKGGKSAISVLESVIFEATTPAEQAKSMGLTSAGFGRWKDKSGKVTHMDAQSSKLQDLIKKGADPDEVLHMATAQTFALQQGFIPVDDTHLMGYAGVSEHAMLKETAGGAEVVFDPVNADSEVARYSPYLEYGVAGTPIAQFDGDAAIHAILRIDSLEKELLNHPIAKSLFDEDERPSDDAIEAASLIVKKYGGQTL